MKPFLNNALYKWKNSFNLLNLEQFPNRNDNILFDRNVYSAVVACIISCLALSNLQLVCKGKLGMDLFSAFYQITNRRLPAQTFFFEIWYSSRTRNDGDTVM